jgi:TolB-like protein
MIAMSGAYQVASAPPAPPRPPVLCIAPFENNTGDDRFTGVAMGLADLLSALLSTDSRTTVVERRQLLAVMKEREWSLRHLSDSGVTARLGALLGAERLVVGGVLLSNQQFVVTAHVTDVKTAAVIASRRVAGSPTNLVSLCRALAQELADTAGLPAMPVPQGLEDKSPSSSLHFLRGLGLYNAGSYDRAAVCFMRCGDVEPDHGLFRYWLGMCHIGMNEPEHARLEFERYLREHSSSSLIPEVQRIVELCVAATTGQKPLLPAPASPPAPAH